MGGVTRLLVANRGEIAVRIARTCREMGIEPVLAYDERDDSRFVQRFFERAVPVSSYLDVGAVMDAARETGCDAIHPGYGFLSERAELAAACEEAGITFVGPRAPSIAAMGSKAVAVKRAVGYIATSKKSSLLRWPVRRSESL